MKRLFRLKHPKTILLAISIALAYLVFSNDYILNLIPQLKNNYISIFIAGIMFSFGFLTPFSIGFFITLHPENILLTAIIGGLGSATADLLIFHSIRVSFMKEFKQVKNTKMIKKIIKLIDKKINHRIRNYLLYILAGIIISSPLPDEIGVTMLAGLTKIKQSVLVLISMVLNIFGIWIILVLSA